MRQHFDDVDSQNMSRTVTLSSQVLKLETYWLSPKSFKRCFISDLGPIFMTLRLYCSLYTCLIFETLSGFFRFKFASMFLDAILIVDNSEITLFSSRDNRHALGCSCRLVS